MSTPEITENTLILDWLPKSGDESWNNPLASVLSVFGLPGHRFNAVPYDDVMLLKFNSSKDAQLCRIMLSERLRSSL